MGKFKDLTGKRFGRLMVVEPTPMRDAKGYVMWKCKCDCGAETIKSSKCIGQGTFSCGCYAREESAKRCMKHGLSRSSIYKTWRSMVYRCTRETAHEYENYGGRGITVCDEWLDFENFCEWAIANGFEEEHDRKHCTLDRIDVNGNYEPSNCRWVTMKTQQRNRRNNVLLTYNGETHCIAEWAEIIGMQAQTIGKRLKAGWSVEDALCKPLSR